MREEHDYERSTKHNHTVSTSDPNGQPTGAFAVLRARLDLHYHGCYTATRQLLQDELIQQTLLTGTACDQPWLVFTAGPMGAGKGYTINWLHEKDLFVLHHLVHCDPDLFKAALPEWPGYVARDKLSAGAHCHRESGMLVEMAVEAALAGSMHCWVDGSLKDGEWYRHMLEDVRMRYPHYSIAILEVQAATDAIFARVSKRAEATGRDVPPEDVLDSIERVPRSVEQLCDLVSFYARLDNSAEDGAPQLTKYCDQDVCYLMRTPEETEKGWAEIRRRFGIRASAVSSSSRL